MATKQKTLKDNLRKQFTEKILDLTNKEFDEVLQVGNSELAIPCLDEENNEEFIVITIKVPTGSRDGEIYDGYAMAEDFKIKQAEKEEKKRIAEEKKAKKIERDKKQREAKAKAKAERESAE